MKEILEYATSSFCVFIGCFSLTTVVLHYGLRIVIRFLRMFNIVLRGWPPPHLDADGDFKSVKTEE